VTLIQDIEKEQVQREPFAFNVGDTVRVDVKITEGERERIHAFAGIVIARKGSGIREMFTVRRIVAGEGVERTFPMHSPAVVGVTVQSPGSVRRAKLYYLRKRVGKATRVKTKRATQAKGDA